MEIMGPGPVRLLIYDCTRAVAADPFSDVRTCIPPRRIVTIFKTLRRKKKKKKWCARVISRIFIEDILVGDAVFFWYTILNAAVMYHGRVHVHCCPQAQYCRESCDIYTHTCFVRRRFMRGENNY